MQCSCGGETLERSIQRKLDVVCLYHQCQACGRQLVVSGAYPEVKEKAKQATRGNFGLGDPGGYKTTAHLNGVPWYSFDRRWFWDAVTK